MTSTARLMSLYADVVADRLGWAAQPHGDGELRVVVADGLVLWLSVDGADPSFVRIRAAYTLEPGDLAPRQLAAAYVTRSIKLVKTDAHDNRVTCSVDLLVAPSNCFPETAHLAAVLPRALHAIREAARRFGREIAKPGPGPDRAAN